MTKSTDLMQQSGQVLNSKLFRIDKNLVQNLISNKSIGFRNDNVLFETRHFLILSHGSWLSIFWVCRSFISTHCSSALSRRVKECFHYLVSWLLVFFPVVYQLFMPGLSEYERNTHLYASHTGRFVSAL